MIARVLRLVAWLLAATLVVAAASACKRQSSSLLRGTFIMARSALSNHWRASSLAPRWQWVMARNSPSRTLPLGSIWKVL